MRPAVFFPGKYWQLFLKFTEGIGRVTVFRNSTDKPATTLHNMNNPEVTRDRKESLVFFPQTGWR